MGSSKEYNKEYYTKNKTTIKEYKKQYTLKNQEKLKTYNKQYRELNPEQRWAWNLKNKFNLTPEQYYKMLEDQQECCGICGKSQEEFKNHFAVDHDHVTGENRGLLCLKCNTGLGYYEKYKTQYEDYLTYGV